MAIQIDARLTQGERLIPILYRLLALCWLAKGFAGWMRLVGMPTEDVAFLLGATATDLKPLIAFSILDIVAGVSLWLSWRWGSGVWALSVVAFIAACLFYGSFAQSGPAIALSLVLLLLHAARIVIAGTMTERRLKIL